MKVISLLLLFAIISLFKAARPNLRSYRKIPNRSNRRQAFVVENIKLARLKSLNNYFRENKAA